MTNKSPGRRQLLFMLLAVAIAAAVLFGLYIFRTPPPDLLPSPNGYDDLVAAGKSLSMNIGRFSGLDSKALRALIETNAESLKLIRLGLSRECMVPSSSYTLNTGSMMADLPALKGAAQLLAAEGRLAELESRPLDAARSYLMDIRMGIEISRGGAIMYRLVGIACESMGGMGLAKLIPQLQCDQLQVLVPELEQMETNTVAWSEVRVAERRFARAQLGRVPNPVMLVAAWWQARKVDAVTKQRHDLIAARIRLLEAEMAIRSYRCRHGTPPASLDQLLPDCLKEPPFDPFGGKPLVYRLSGTNWTLYSIGPDLVDDGGKPASRVRADGTAGGTAAGQTGTTKLKGDLFYDSPW
jgi:hypothetical protein